MNSFDTKHDLPPVHPGEIMPVKNVFAGEDFVLFIDFDNGEQGKLDMKPFLDCGVFQRLKDRNAFKRVRVAFDTIEWE
jgi:hypothetical protein